MADGILAGTENEGEKIKSSNQDQQEKLSVESCVSGARILRGRLGVVVNRMMILDGEESTPYQVRYHKVEDGDS